MPQMFLGTAPFTVQDFCGFGLVVLGRREEAVSAAESCTVQDFLRLRRPVHLCPCCPILPLQHLPQLYRECLPAGERHRHFRHKPLHVASKPAVVRVSGLQLGGMGEIGVADLRLSRADRAVPLGASRSPSGPTARMLTWTWG